MNQLYFYLKECNVKNCATIQLAQELLNFYPKFSKWRIIWGIIICCGLRPCEVVNLTLSNFQNNFSILKYVVRKAKIKFKNNKKILCGKINSVPIPSWLSEELKIYLSQFNPNSILSIKIFNLKSEDSIRKELNRIRPILGKNNPFWLEKHFVQGATKYQYNITPYSFRRLHKTWLYYYLQEEKGLDPFVSAILTQKKTAHEKLETTSVYLFSKEDIGISEKIRSWDEYLNIPKNQKKLSEFFTQ